MYTHPAVHLRMIKVHLMENFQISAWKYVPFLIKIVSLIIAHFAKKKTGANRPLSELLSRRIQHILNENTIPACRVVYKDMGHCADQLPILDNRTARHE